MAVKEKLGEYCRKTISDSRYGKQRFDWAFGAIIFASSAGLISSEEYRALLEEFQLFE